MFKPKKFLFQINGIKIFLIIFILLLNLPLVASKINLSTITLVYTHSIKEQIVDITDDDVLIKRTTIYYINNELNDNLSILSNLKSLSTCYEVDAATASGTKSYVINPVNSIGIDESTFSSTISTSAETWDEETTQEMFNPYTIDTSATASVYDAYPDDKNTIMIGSLGIYYTAIAITQSWYYISTMKISHFDIIFNQNLPLGDASVNPSLFDLQSIGTHEFGHTFGLNDLYTSPCNQETMYGYGSKGETFARTLNDGDITGLNIIYPSETPTPTPTPEPTPTPTPIPDTTAPSSITNLHNITYSQNYINWTWTDPQDTDFDVVKIYLNGYFQRSITKGVQYYNATGLKVGSTHKIATRTMDTGGNINTTWVNHTSITAPLPDTTAPSSITNLHNITYSQNYINWTWTDSTEADFSKVIIYFDGSFKTNVTKSVQYYNATGLTAASTHTIATRTVDTAGNINTTGVNHTSITAPLPDTTAPSSITNLHNITYSQNYINWTWTDSIDSDFSKVMIYLDGSFKTNVTKGVQYYNATGLTAASTHTIATKTVDTAGNINTTGVNNTSITAPLPDTTAPSSITNLHNITYSQNYINWTWTDTPEADFSKVMIYLDGSYQTNVTKGGQYFNATGLTAGSEHTIATRTVDIFGNINQTWVNHTATTLSLGGLRGDVNRNSILDTGDATLILRYLVELPTPSEYPPILPIGDMNCNDIIDTGDATLILRDIVGLDIPRCWE